MERVERVRGVGDVREVREVSGRAGERMRERERGSRCKCLMYAHMDAKKSAQPFVPGAVDRVMCIHRGVLQLL